LLKGSELSTSSQRGKFIDFVAAKQREVSKKVATKQKWVNEQKVQNVKRIIVMTPNICARSIFIIHNVSDVFFL